MFTEPFLLMMNDIALLAIIDIPTLVVPIMGFSFVIF
jgi:hypothetical protein